MSDTTPDRNMDSVEKSEGYKKERHDALMMGVVSFCLVAGVGLTCKLTVSKGAESLFCFTGGIIYFWCAQVFLISLIKDKK